MYTKNRYKSFTYNWSSYKNNLENKIIACQPIQFYPIKKYKILNSPLFYVISLNIR